MGNVERYRQIIIELLTPFAERQYANANVTNELVFDQEHDRYLVMSAGWEGNEKRIHYCLVHLDIIDGKVWIQRDNTEDGIGYDLEKAGIPKTDIVPAFHPVNVRPFTGYAVA
jgi:hypothetical protein